MREKEYDELLSVKELADRLARNPRYVYAMKRDGFLMPGGRATLAGAIEWLGNNTGFRQCRARSTIGAQD